MAEKTKGIVIEIGAETDGFTSAIKNLKKESGSLQAELRNVDKALKLDPTNTDLLRQKEELLAKQVEAVTKNVETLKTAKARADKDMANGTRINEEEYRRLVREISSAEQQLRQTRAEADKFARACESAGGKMVEIGKKGMVASAAVIGSMTAAATSTKEYREDMNRLTTAFETTGKSAEVAKSTYLSFYTVLGEEDRSVEAVNHLAKLCTTEEELALWTDICAGVSATFGDSLPIEGLTEAANETAKVGKVTGPLADALNWAGINEDKFNESLEKCADEQARSALITNTLSGTYNAAAQAFKESNAEIIKGREAHQKLTDATAALGAVVEPYMTKLANAITKATDKFLSLDESGQKAVIALAAAAATVPPLLIGMGNVVTGMGKVKTAVTALKIAAMPKSILAISAAITALAAVIVMSKGNIDEETAAISRLRKESEKRTKEINDRIKQYNELKEASKENVSASLSEINHTQALRESLKELVDENGRVDEKNRARVSFIIGELNRALGTEYTLTGNQVEKYGELCRSIDGVIASRKAEIILSSKEDVYRTAIQNAEKATAAAESASKAYAKAKKEYEEFKEEYNKKDDTDITSNDITKMRELTELVRTTNDEFVTASREYKKYLSDIKNYEDLYVKYSEQGAEAFIAAWEKKVYTAKEKGKETGEKLVDGIKEGLNADELKSIGENAVNGFIAGMERKDPFLKETAKRMARQIPSVFNKELLINSPSKKMIPTGEAIPEGIVVGVKNKEKELLTAIQQQAQTLSETYDKKIKAYSSLAAIATAKLGIWQYQAPSAAAIEVAKNNLSVLRYREQFQNQATYEADINRRLTKEAYGENSDEYIEAELEYYKQFEALAKLMQEVQSAQTEFALYKSGKKFNQDVYDLAENKYKLWELENPSATEDEKTKKRKEMLTAQYAEQGKKVAELNDRLYEEIQISGEASEASIKLQNQLVTEKIAYTELANAISEVSAARAGSSVGSGTRTSAQDYTSYKIAYGAGLREAGYSDEEVDTAARKVSGYTGGITVVNNNYGITSDTAYTVSRETAKTANNLAMQGVL